MSREDFQRNDLVRWKTRHTRATTVARVRVVRPRESREL